MRAAGKTRLRGGSGGNVHLNVSRPRPASGQTNNTSIRFFYGEKERANKEILLFVRALEFMVFICSQPPMHSKGADQAPSKKKDS